MRSPVSGLAGCWLVRGCLLPRLSHFGSGLSVVCSLLALAACSASRDSTQPSASARLRSFDAPPARPLAARAEPASPAVGHYKLGKPYRIGSVWYVPREEPGYDRTGTGSWYGSDFHGRATANGERYNMDALTAAHPTLPLPSYVYVTNLANNRTVLVRVNDRGPYVGGRLIDMSRAAARALGYEHLGTAQLHVRYAGRAPLDGDSSRETAFIRQQPWYGALAAAPAIPATPPPRRPNAGASSWSSGWGLFRSF
jgi:rare lipoprotein A